MERKAQNIRNVGIIAHVDAGKTTLSERILYYCQATKTMGEVPYGTTVMDYLPEEQERGITIRAACMTCTWRKWRCTLVDTPGHVDFTGEVARSLRVIDGAVVVFSAIDGIESQSESVWKQADRFSLPRIVFLNKTDRDGADWESVYRAMPERLHNTFALLTLPLYNGHELESILDIVSGRELFFDQESHGAKVTVRKIRDEHRSLYETCRDELLERVCDADEVFMQKWADDNWKENDLVQAIGRSCQKGLLVPVYCGSALKNFGVQPLLDGIGHFLPSPARKAPPLYDQFGRQAREKPAREDMVGLVFKVVTMQHRRLAWIRLFQGSIRRGETLYLSRNLSIKTSTTLFRIDAEQIIDLEEAYAGDICACLSSSLQSGDTCLSVPMPVFLEPLPGCPQVMTQKFEPLRQEDYALLAIALERFCEEDTTLTYERDEETGCFHVHGMGELHFAVLEERLMREYALTLHKTKPSVSYRESIAEEASHEEDVLLAVGDFSQHGKVALKVAPLAEGSGVRIEFTKKIQEKVARPLLEAARLGVRNALDRGVLAEWPVTDVGVVIEDIGRGDDASALGTRAAAERALSGALRKAGLFLLWPIMRVEISLPQDLVGSAMTLFTGLGSLDGLEERFGEAVILGHAPLSRLLGFAGKLRSQTQGRARFECAFLRYGRVEGETV